MVWDYSESPTLFRLLAVPYVPVPGGRKLGGEGAFGKWENALGRHYAMYSERTNRLFVQFRLADRGELVAPGDLAGRIRGFLEGLAIRGLEPYSDGYVRRVDVAVDLRCPPEDGRRIIDGMAAVRLPDGRRVEVVGDPRSTVYFMPRKGRSKLARTYCRNLLTGEGEPYGLIRLEAQHMFDYGQVPLPSLLNERAAGGLWLTRFGGEELNVRVRRLDRETQTSYLADLVRDGVVTFGQMERISTFLDLERLGRAREIYPPSAYGLRRRQVRNLGLAKNDVGEGVVDVNLAEYLAPARELWAA